MTPVDGADAGDDSLVYLCSVQSREDGTFTFPSLASGAYTVVRFLLSVRQNAFLLSSKINLLSVKYTNVI